jgi:hypothetical protein
VASVVSSEPHAARDDAIVPLSACAIQLALDFVLELGEVIEPIIKTPPARLPPAVVEVHAPGRRSLERRIHTESRPSVGVLK